MQGYKVTSNREYAQNESYTGVRGNRIAELGRESGGTYVCGCVGAGKTHVEEWKTGNFCTYDRFSADGARTRTTRGIRWRVLGG